MKQLNVLAVVSLFASCTPAWSITKCTGPDGKTVFQDVPCAGKSEQLVIRPASGHGEAQKPRRDGGPSSSANAPLPQQEGAFGASWQRRTFLENRGIADARSALQSHQSRCDAQQRELAAKKRNANNNLAGATWEQSISTEMQAAATVCDSKGRELKSTLESLEKELRELQARQ
ncbi:hypothetical protein [Acidovorax sp. SUPP2825]|uniref:hypothetical protein n=1 Tax=Acidovorax sp. SUPP2825 TaxID=2920879 RepID=UPI0023DE5837|nr:hypothetical protein [Acidovorax sp. SUPP2825]GKS96926.1 DUF4124 domain-containing protein [Acidovorax sp. SUPP2825]